MKKVLGILFGLMLVTVSLVILYLSMRSVMAIGGYCAEGGPYIIATHCPKGVDWLMTLSIFALTGGVSLYTSIVGGMPQSPQWYYFFWTALFGSLGWNFLDFAIHPPKGMADGAVGWWICAALFMIMAFGPLLAIIFGVGKAPFGKESGSFGAILLGKPTTKTNIPIGAPAEIGQDVLVAVHAIAVVGGFFLGLYLFNTLT